MSKYETEKLIVDIESNINKAEHIATKIVQEYGLDRIPANRAESMRFAENRINMGMDMDILIDYIQAVCSQCKAILDTIEA